MFLRFPPGKNPARRGKDRHTHSAEDARNFLRADIPAQAGAADAFVEIYNPSDAAVSLSGWTLTDSNGSLQLTADVQEADDTRVSQHPLTFVVSRGDKPAWRWPVHTLQISAGTLTASLVPEE